MYFTAHDLSYKNTYNKSHKMSALGFVYLTNFRLHSRLIP